MKVTIILVVMCAFVVCSMAEDKKICETNADCSRQDECCVRIHAFTDKTCKKLRKKGEFCGPTDALNRTSFYKFMCPCTEGLTCEEEKIELVDVVDVTLAGGRCIDKKR